jgi:flavin-dependent dehydrogenase
MITDQQDYDVLIMGGGLAGLTLALQLLKRRAEMRVLVVERLEHPVPEAAHKVGEATVDMGAHYFAEVLGLRDYLKSNQLWKMGLRFFPAVQNPPPPLSQRAETGPSSFHPGQTYQLDRGRLENALGAMVVEAGGEFRHGCRVERFILDSSGHTVTLSGNGERDSVRARWLIDASGRRGLIKNKLKLQEEVGHDCNAVWLRLDEMIWMDRLIEEEDPPPEPGAAARWHRRVSNGQRWRSTNHLMGRGYWAWLIPLASGSISVGLVADPRYVPFEEINTFEGLLAWTRENEPELGRALESRRDALQDFHMLRHYSHGCKQVFSAERWALTGEAGVFTDPLYSPGSNFIALSNTLVTELVMRDLDEQPIEDLAVRYDAFYLWGFKSLMPTWEGQYGLMGNPQVWAAKSTWDIFTYMVLPGVLYHNELLIDLDFMETIAEQFGRYSALNHRMQSFFREWDELDAGTDEARFVDTGKGLLPEMLKAVSAPLRPDQVRLRVSENIELAEDVARVIMAGAASRIGITVDAGDIDPMSFQLGEQPARGEALSPARRSSLARAGTLLGGLWEPAGERSASLTGDRV